MSISIGKKEVDAYKGITACFYTRSYDGEEKDLSMYFEYTSDEGDVHCMVKVGYKDGTTKEIEFLADFLDDDGNYEAIYMIKDMTDVVIVMACFTAVFDNSKEQHLAEFDERFKDELAHWKV
jgi:hypothetical protein